MNSEVSRDFERATLNLIHLCLENLKEHADEGDFTSFRYNFTKDILLSTLEYQEICQIEQESLKSKINSNNIKDNLKKTPNSVKNES